MLICKICNFEGKNLITHLKFKHQISVGEYKKKYNVDRVLIQPSPSEKVRKIVSEKNKKWWKNKTLFDKKKGSIRCKEYWLNKGFSEIVAKNKVSEIQRRYANKFINKYTKEEFKKFSIRCKEYYIERGFNEKDAIKLAHKYQSYCSNKSKRFLGKKHKKLSREKISISMSKFIDVYGSDKWIQHFGNYCIQSKGEIDLFNYIKKNINSNVESNKLILGKIPDIVDEKTKKIVEYYGDFWHANPKFFKNDDVNKFGVKISDIWDSNKKREIFLIENHYDVMIVWESDWKNNNKNVIKKIKNFYEYSNT